VFGSFGNDFLTFDGRRVMVVALTSGQWRALRDLTGRARSSALEAVLAADLDLEPIPTAGSPWRSPPRRATTRC
jgi:2-methylfumaryl-CoA isomerase